MNQAKTKLWYLKNLDIFSEMRHEEHELIESYTQMREVKKGESLYFQGFKDEKFYMLKKGAVKIVKLLPQGRELIVDIIAAGSFFGEMLAVDSRERDESAVMVEDGLICEIRRTDFRRLQDLVPGLSLRLSKTLGMRYWKRENKLIDLIYNTVEQRLSKTVLALLEDFGVPHDTGFLLKIKLSHKDFADLVASTRETVTATFSKLKKKGLFRMESGYIVVPSMAKLREAAREDTSP